MTIHRDVDFYAAVLGSGDAVTHEVKSGRAVWVQVAKGTAVLNGEQLYPGDGVAIETAGKLELSGTSDSEVLVFDMAT